MTEPSQNLPTPKKGSWTKWLIPLVLFLLFVLGILVSYQQKSSQGFKELPKFNLPDQERLTQLAPDIELLDLKGKKVRLSDFRGKAVLINFWSITCPACLIELRSLVSLSEQLSGKPFALLAITSNSRDDIKEFLDRTGLKLPAYFDYSGEAATRFGVYYLPASFVIDPKGRLVDRFMGAANWADPAVITYFQQLIELYQPKPSNP